MAGGLLMASVPAHAGLLNNIGKTKASTPVVIEPGTDLDAPDGVQSHLLHAVNFHKPTRLNRGCIGVLTWSSPDAHAWEPLEAPWLAAYTRSTWRGLAE